MADTVGKLSEEIITEYYKQVKNDNSNYTLRHIAQQVATEIAVQAWGNAIEQDKLGESVYANDMFITPFFGLDLLTDDNGSKYVPMPNTPAGLPQQREVAYVGFTGNKKTQVYPIRNKDRFMQQMLPTPKWMVMYYVEGNNIVFDNISSLITGPVDLKLVGAMPEGELVNMPINAPKNVQSMIFDKILGRMISQRNVLPDNINDNVSK
jgi:hypothetical protein